jgi:hypothetical protein
VRRVLSAIALFVFCAAVATAGPAGDPRGNARQIARPETTQSSLLQWLRKRAKSWLGTLEEPPPPPPPGEDPGRSNGPVPN